MTRRWRWRSRSRNQGGGSVVEKNMTTFPVLRAGAAVAFLLLAAGGCATRTPAPGAPPASSAPAASAPAASAPASPAGGTGSASPAAPTATTPPRTPGAGAVPVTIAGTVFLNPALTSTGGRLYLRWDLTREEPPGGVSPRGLARVDPATGRILAANTSVPGSAGLPAYAAGALWVTESVSGGEFLLRMDPLTLAITGRLKVTGGSYPVGAVGGSGSHIAFAGGLVWVDGVDRLLAVSPPAMSVRRTVTFPHADSSDVTASADGTTLIVSEAVAGAGSVQRRDPVSGALLASVTMGGVVAPMLAGVTSGSTWISEPTGMMGYIERLDTATLTADDASRVEGSNGIRASLWDGELWVTNLGGGPSRNYCADPATGRRLATSPLPDLNQDYVVTVAGHRMYYLVPAGSGFRIRTAPVPAICG